MAEKSIDTRIQNFVGGILGGVASSTFSAPLDLARTRLQIQSFLKANTRKYKGLCQSLKVIYKEEGVRGLFKGYSATLVAVPSYHAMYFTSYEHVKDHLKSKFPTWHNSLINSLAAGITGVVCDAGTNPLWIVRQRMQTQFMHMGDTIQNAGFTQTFKSIIKDEGPRALYRGLIASIIGVSHAMIFFPLYEYLKDHVIRDKNGESKNQHVIASSVIAKTIASAMTYPTAVVRTRQQENPRLFASYFHGNAHPNIRKIVSDTWKEAGIKGFYAGFSADLARILPVTAIIFMTFELTKKAFGSLRSEKH